YSSEACIKYYIKIKCKDTEQGKDNIGDKAETLTMYLYGATESMVTVSIIIVSVTSSTSVISVFET
ncbi:hypothetical protein, partial [Bacteroides sp. 519]|uniref:hypothetical protein n=1 Tax=Bacteroides sp. 519 TaxID=2302937 RepID=UPI0019402F0F